MDAGSRTPEAVQVGLNKGEARNALARAVFFNRQGELRDRTFENQRYRASGLNLVVLAIILWNTMYLERAINALQQHGIAFPDALLPHVSPIGWEHINLTGDYTWQSNRRVAQGGLRPLRQALQFRLIAARLSSKSNSSAVWLRTSRKSSATSLGLARSMY